MFPAAALADVLVGAANLLALTIAPRWLSPDPANPVLGYAAVAILAALGWLALRARSAPDPGRQLVRATTGLWVLAVVACVVGSARTRDTDPLARAVPFVAPLVWIAIAATAGTIARALLPAASRAGALAAAAALAIGALLVGSASPFLFSTPILWRRALAADAANERAVAAVAVELAPRRDRAEVRAIAEGCVAARFTACTCQSLRVRFDVAAKELPRAIEHARSAAEACPTSVGVRAAFAEALASTGAHDAAFSETMRGFDLLRAAPAGSVPAPVEAALHYAQGLALHGLGRMAAARAAADRSIALAPSREARLLATTIEYAAGDRDAAQKHVDAMLAADPADPDATYNRALLADGRGDYHRARSGYLETLGLDAGYAVARFNLAVLTWRWGQRDESRGHVKKFVDTFPDDPRGADLLAMIRGPAL